MIITLVSTLESLPGLIENALSDGYFLGTDRLLASDRIVLRIDSVPLWLIRL